MKNGYYVSAYCCIDEVGCALGAQIRHDQAIALWKVEAPKVILVKYWELERITRKKQHMQPFCSIDHFKFVLQELLKEVNLQLDDVLEIWGMPEFFSSIDYVKMAKASNLPFHSIAHSFSALIDTNILFQQKQLILSLDGGPDNLLDNGFDLPNHYAAILFDKGKIVSIESVNSPAYIWAEASDKFLIREGTLMALAEACLCECNDEAAKLNISKFKSMWDIPQLRSEFERVWEIIEKSDLVLDNRFSLQENRISAFMKIVCEFSRNIVYYEINRLIKKLHIIPQETRLSIVGGFALNCPINTWIMQQFHFLEFVAPPCVNDSGIALGIGLVAFYTVFGENLKFKLEKPFYGHKENFLEFETKYHSYIKSISDFDENIFIQDIESFPICWFEGESEIGPRALGHRSILSSARSIAMKDKLNKIKLREWWRPVAPIVLFEVINDWCKPAFESPFMLHAVEVIDNKRDLVPAILHLNNSARIQTITSSSSLYEVLKRYHSLTDVAMICNTSLNDKGEPIINTYDELINFALRKNFKVIYVERKRIKLKNHRLFTEKKPHETRNPFDDYLKKIFPSLIAKYKNVSLDNEMLDFFLNHRTYFKGIDINSASLHESILKVKIKIYEILSS